MENFEKFIVELLENKIREVRRIRKAREKAMTAGIAEGRKKGILSVAKNMVTKNMEIKEIEELTGLTQEEIQNLVKNEN